MICRTVGHLMLLNLWPVVTSNGKFVLLNLASVKILFRSCFFYNNFLYIIYQEQLTLMTSKGPQITLPKTEYSTMGLVETIDTGEGSYILGKFRL